MTRALLILILAISACRASTNNLDGDENVSIKANDNGQMSFTLPFAKGEVQVPHGSFENGQMDIDGVKMIPGGTLHGFNVDAGDGGSTVHLSFDAPRSPDEVRGYFLSQFKMKGDEASQSGNAIVGRTKDGDTFTIQVEPAAQGSTGNVAIRSKD